MVARRRTVPQGNAPESGDLSHETKTNGFAGETLLQFIERFERISEEITGLTEDRTEIMSEAKGSGYDTKIMRKIIAERKMDKADLQETDAMLDLYRTGIARAEKERFDKSVRDGAGPADEE